MDEFGDMWDGYPVARHRGYAIYRDEECGLYWEQGAFYESFADAKAAIDSHLNGMGCSVRPINEQPNVMFA